MVEAQQVGLLEVTMVQLWLHDRFSEAELKTEESVILHTVVGDGGGMGNNSIDMESGSCS